MSNNNHRNKIWVHGLAALVGVMALAIAVPANADGRHEHANGKTAGIGMMVGMTTGITGKIYTDSPFAFSLGFGSHHDGLDPHYHGFTGQLDLLWHPVRLFADRALEVPLFVGVGSRVVSYDHFHDDLMDPHTAVGVRAPAGVSMEFRDAPADIFFELALGMDVVGDSHAGDIYLGGTVGGRYFF